MTERTDMETQAAVAQALSKEGVFKGHHGLVGLLDCQEFWHMQEYNTRLYYGEGIADYLHRDVLRATVSALAKATPKPEGRTDTECAHVIGLQDIPHEGGQGTSIPNPTLLVLWPWLTATNTPTRLLYDTTRSKITRPFNYCPDCGEKLAAMDAEGEG